MEQKLHNVTFLHSLLIYTISNTTVKNAPNRACSFGTRVCWVQEISFFGHKINLLFTIKNNIKLITIRLSNDSTCTPLLMRFFGPGKIRVKGKPSYRRSILLLKTKTGNINDAYAVWFIFYCHIRGSVDQKGVKKGNVMKFLLHFVPLNVFKFLCNKLYIMYQFVFNNI